MSFSLLFQPSPGATALAWFNALWVSTFTISLLYAADALLLALGLHSSAATYLRNTKDELFTVRKLNEQGIAPELVMVATCPVEREFREINRPIEISPGRGDEVVQRVTRLLVGSQYDEKLISLESMTKRCQ